jgi:hypothetical protein
MAKAPKPARKRAAKPPTPVRTATRGENEALQDFELEEAENRKAVLAVLPEGADSDAVWAAVYETAHLYLLWHFERIQRPMVPLRKMWERRIAMLDALAEEVRAEKKIRPVKGSDPLLENRVLTELFKLRERWSAELTRCQVLTHPKQFGGRADAHRQLLYEDLLRAWIRYAGGKLAFTSGGWTGAPPHGPVITYLDTCLAIIMKTEKPSPQGLAGIVKKWRAGSRHQGSQKKIQKPV